MRDLINSLLLSYLCLIRLALAAPQLGNLTAAEQNHPPDSGVRYSGLVCLTPHNKTDPYEPTGLVELYDYVYPYDDPRSGFDAITFDAFLERALFNIMGDRAESHSGPDWPVPSNFWVYNDKQSGLAIMVYRGGEALDWARAISYRDITQIITVLRASWLSDIRIAGWKVPSATFVLSIGDYPDSVVPIRMALGAVGWGSSLKSRFPGRLSGFLPPALSEGVEAY